MTKNEKIKAAATEIVLRTEKTIQAFCKSIGRPSAPTDQHLLDEAVTSNVKIIKKHLQ